MYFRLVLTYGLYHEELISALGIASDWRRYCMQAMPIMHFPHRQWVHICSEVGHGFVPFPTQFNGIAAVKTLITFLCSSPNFIIRNICLFELS